jgi:ribose transport system permease protein
MTILRRALSNGTTLALVILIVMYVVYMYSSIDVLTAANATDLLNNAAPLVIAATGLTLVIVVGGFDLSLGGVVTLSNVILATQTGATTGSAIFSLVLALLAGVLVGALNGFLVAYLHVQSIAATLGTFIMCSGLALVIMPSPGGSVPDFISPGLNSSIGPVPVSLLVILACVAAYLVLKRTRMGIHIFAVGLDEGAATQSGIRAATVKFRVYLAAGLLYAVAGVMLSALTASGDPNGSSLFMVLVFAAVAIGGAKFGGGRGSAIGSILGAGVLAVLQKMLFAIGVSTFYTGIFQGAILIVAVLIGLISLRMGEARPPQLALEDAESQSPARHARFSGRRS